MEVKYFIGLVVILSACTIRGKIQEYSQSTDKICNLIFFFKSLLFHFLVYVNSEFWRNHYQWMVSRFDLFIFIVLQRKCLFTYTFYIRSLFSYLYNWTWPNLASTRSWMYQDWLFWWTSLSRVSAVGIRKWRHPFFEIFYPSLPLVIHFTK